MKTTILYGRVLLRTVNVAAALWLAVSFPHCAEATQPIRLNIEKSAFDSSVKLSWDAEQGKTYKLWTKTNLHSASPWTQLGDEMVADYSPYEVYLFADLPQAYFRLEREYLAGGSVLLQQGQVLSGTVVINTTAFAGPSSSIVNIELLDIDPTTGLTNVLDTSAVFGSTNASFEIDTSNMQNGPHQLRIHVTDDSGGVYTENAIDEFSDPIEVVVRNSIYVPNEDPLLTSWMFELEFGTLVSNGLWRVELWDENGGLYAWVDGDIASDMDPDGKIRLADGWIDDGGGPRPRNWYDDYPNEYFDVLIFVWPDGWDQGAAAKGGGPVLNEPTPNDAGGTNAPTMKYIRSRINHRPTRRVSMAVEWPIIPRNFLRNAMNTLMDTFYVGLSPYSWHFNLGNMSSDHNQQPAAEGWGFIQGPQSWTNLNAVLAGGPNKGYGGSERVSHLFYFGHGFAGGIGSQSGGAGAQVTADTLREFGYWEKSNHIFVITGPPPWSGEIKATFWVRRAGLTFCFLDACNAGSFLRTLMIDLNFRNNGQPTLANLISDGNYPFYGCGWTRTKVASIRNGQDLDFAHFDYAARFIAQTLVQDPATGLPANTYRQSREIARHWSNSPGTVNPAAGGWTHVGCDELFIDE